MGAICLLPGITQDFVLLTLDFVEMPFLVFYTMQKQTTESSLVLHLPHVG